MQVGVGFSDHPDTSRAGQQALASAIKKSGKTESCDLIILFATARHDFYLLKKSILSYLEKDVKIVGGGAIGAISNEHFGYAGDQLILACIWFEKVTYKLFAQSDLNMGEEKVGYELGKKLAKAGTTPITPTLLFYDSIDKRSVDLRLFMATPILEGIEKGLGFLPDINGAGLEGDFSHSPTPQWIGDDIVSRHLFALSFSGDIQVDSTVMLGCRPATPYYTVTKADGRTILEINHEPALPFILNLLGNKLKAEEFPYFLILGVNKGNKYANFNDSTYVNRMCINIDKNRKGLVMFEPDMVAGTEFQIMYRSLEHPYLKPKIKKIFDNIPDRKPVFALYINCAGRAAGYAGIDLEDAYLVQKAVKDKVPLMGIYTGVEISSVAGKPRGLDWTGVFCLFSIPNK